MRWWRRGNEGGIGSGRREGEHAVVVVRGVVGRGGGGGGGEPLSLKRVKGHGHGHAAGVGGGHVPEHFSSPLKSMDWKP